MRLSRQVLSFVLLAAPVLSSPLWTLDSRSPLSPDPNLPSRAIAGLAAHHPVRPRAPENTSVDPEAVTGTTCTDPTAALVTHDTDVAILSICGGIAGTVEFCGGDPATTVGASGTSKFTLTAVDGGATINVSKGRWEGCVRAAQAVCPTGTFSSTCVGGTSDGVGFTFVLSQND